MPLRVHLGEQYNIVYEQFRVIYNHLIYKQIYSKGSKNAFLGDGMLFAFLYNEVRLLIYTVNWILAKRQKIETKFM